MRDFRGTDERDRVSAYVWDRCSALEKVAMAIRGAHES